MLTLADMSDMSEDSIKNHLADHYGATHAETNQLQVLVAYESVGNWGCDSSSWFLFKCLVTGELLVNHGSHCSCMGFENQWSPETTTREYLLSDHFTLSCGGYDTEDELHRERVKEFVKYFI